jgi:hypothetical protein
MGSTGIHREAGLTTRQIMEAELPETLTVRGKILASAMVGSTFYAAVQQQPGTPDAGKVWALVVLTWKSGGYFNFTYKDMDEDMGPNEATCPDKILDLLSRLPECSHTETVCKWCNSEISDETGVWCYYPTKGQTPDCGGPRCYSGYLSTAPRPADGGAPFHAPGGHSLLCSSNNAREFRAASRAYNARVRLAKQVTRGTVVKFPRTIKFTSGIEGDTFTYLERNTFLLDGYRVSLGRDWKGSSFEIVKAA